MSVLTDIYKIYLTVGSEDILFPQTSDTVDVSNEDNTQSEKLVNGRPFTYAQLDGPMTYKFEVEITRKVYPYTFKEAYKGTQYFKDLFKQIKETREPVELSIIRTHDEPPLHEKVYLQDYSFKEEASNFSDYIYSLTFIQYCPQRNQELQTTETHHLLTAGEATGWSTEMKGAIREAVDSANDDAQIKAAYQQERMEARGV